MKELAANEAKKHIHNDHEKAEHEEERRIHDNAHDRRWYANDKEEHINKKGTDFLGPIHSRCLFIEIRSKDHGNKGNPYILAAEEGIAHF